MSSHQLSADLMCLVIPFIQFLPCRKREDVINGLHAVQQGWWRSCLLRTLLRFGAPKVASSYPLRWAQAVATYKCHTHTHTRTHVARIWCLHHVCQQKKERLPLNPKLKIGQAICVIDGLGQHTTWTAARAPACLAFFCGTG